eukprot:TRINITY_DN782185_c0_g1_i1.p1 TRINITY_DN782185_c0_g1~~TRINITY_DN782185_c0_g1_i1.p1  ORF type:complete len:426 (-),score=183.79 TRINITY_DN782185_c0_g1_i1:143-1399(-)
MKTFDVRGERGLIDAEKAKELVKPILEEGNVDYEKIILSSRTYSPEAAEVIGSALNKLEGLKIVDLSDIISGIPMDAANATLKTISDAIKDKKFVELDLSNNALGPHGIEACKELLENRKDLERVYLCNDGISAEAAVTVVDLLLFETPSKLKLFHSFNNMSGTGGAMAIAKLIENSPKLEDFRMSTTRCTRDAGLEVAKALKTVENLTALDLADNVFGEEAAVVIAELIKNHKDLKKLCLSDTLIGEDGVTAVCKSLLECADQLEILKLGSCDLAEEHIDDFFLDTLRSKSSTLRVLGLAENPFLSPEGIVTIAEEVAKFEKIEEVDFSFCELNSRTGINILKALLQAENIKCINLNGNEFSERALKKMTEMLKAVGKEDIKFPIDDNMEPFEESEDEEDTAAASEELEKKIESLSV